MRETVVDAVGNGWQTQYDSIGRILSLSDPDSGVEIREYNDSGELTAVINALGERTEFAYDLLGRILTKKTLVGTPSEETTTFVFDEARVGYFNVGALTSMLDTAGHRYDDYDALGRPGRVERSIDATNYVFAHAYNTSGMPSSTTYPDAQTISWTYDAAGNLQTETGTISTASYDAFGRPTSLSFANGVVTNYAFSPTRGWIDNIQTTKGATTHQNLTYARYSDGMISTITSAKSMESWTYVYDDLNRLLSATNVDTPGLTQSFTYDDVGNMTYNSSIGSYTYRTPGTGQPHAVQTAGARSYVYDAVGRMTSRNGQVIQWNGAGKPSSIGSVAFSYGGTGERLKKVSGSATTRYVGGDYEIAPDGTVTKYLIGGKQVDANFFINHSDHLGSIQAVTDATGIEVRRQDHEPFGNQHFASGSHAESKGWIGEREEETELVYLNARYYDPEIGRFTAPDPIVRLGQKLNRYSYSRNNPINLSDPSGLDEDGSVCVSRVQFGNRVTYHSCGGDFRDPEYEEQQRRREYEEYLRNSSDAGDDLLDDDPGSDGPDGGDRYPYCVPDCWWFPGEPAGPEKPPSNPTPNKPLVNPNAPPTDCDTFFGCGSGTKLAQQVVQKWDNDVKLNTAAFVFSAAVLVPPAVAVLGAGGGATTVGISAASFFGGAAGGGGSSAVSIVFSHGARHLAGTGLSARVVEAAIAAEIRSLVAGGAELVRGFGGRLLVEAATIEYRALVLASGVVNVGTYYPK